MARVVCAGHVNWDVTLQLDRLPEPDGEAAITDQFQSTGGSAANVARTLAGLDVEPALFGSVGGDNNGLLARRQLEEGGVDCTHLRGVEGEATAVKYLLVDDDGEVMVLGNDGANELFDPEHVDEATVQAADHVHLTSQRPATAAAIARIARDAGVPVSFDPGRRLDERDYDDVVANATTLFLNDREADRAREVGYLDDWSGTVVRKLGASGATIQRDRDSRPAGGDGDGDSPETVSHAGFAVDPVDTTGAGDAFAAGFIAAQLDGSDAERALAVANACGALAARVSGSRAEIGWRDIEALLDIGPAE